MTGGSRQLRQFRCAIRDGASVEHAAQASGLGLAEARLTIAEDAKYPPPPEAFKFLSNPEAAGCAVTRQGDLIMPDENDAMPLADMAADTLRGDVRDAMLSWFKATPKPWSQMGEAEQRDFVDTVERVSASILKQACQIIAANERPCMLATLVEYKAKDGLEAKLKLVGTGDNAAHLHEAVGREVLVVTSGYEEVAGEAAPAEVDADQRDLGIGDEYQQAA
jgi:hypothetical protein